NSLLLSFIVVPNASLTVQFALNVYAALAVVNALKRLIPGCVPKIKWPNDVILNDKKTAGILIENVIRGQEWTNAIIGIGLNVHQQTFPSDLPQAGSLKSILGVDVNKSELFKTLREEFFENLDRFKHPENLWKEVNEILYKKEEQQWFRKGEKLQSFLIKKINEDGHL